MLIFCKQITRFVDTIPKYTICKFDSLFDTSALDIALVKASILSATYLISKNIIKTLDNAL